MSVLSDVLEFFRELVRGNTEDSDNRRKVQDEDVPLWKALLHNGFNVWLSAEQGAFGEQAKELVQSIDDKIDSMSNTAQGFTGDFTAAIARQLDTLLESLSVQRSEGIGVGDDVTAKEELEEYQSQSLRAINGATVAFGVVTALNTSALLADQGEQVVSLGQIEGFQQFVQNVIWSLGLADAAGLIFRPQIATSMGPLLTRHWNDKAQAQIPGQGDLIRFLVREVFNPDRRKVLRSDDDLTGLYPFMRQQGFSDFWTDSYWASHWNLPSTTQLNEMVHRGVIPEDEWERQVRFNDYVPEAIPWLKEIIYSPFTRVDARRMHELGVLDDQQLLSAYADLGYPAPMAQDASGKLTAQFVSEEQFDASKHRAQALVIFTRVYNILPDIRRRLANGFLAPTDVEPAIRALGVPPSTAQRITETLVKATDLGTAEATKELTTSQITRGYKAGLVSFAQALFLLEELGWGSSRAEFLLRLTLSLDEAQLDATELGTRLTRGQV